MGRPREHDEATRVALLEAAEQLVSEGGLDAVGVRPVAERAGTSTRAVYALFGSRQGLMQALAQRAFQLLAQRVDSVSPTDDAGEDLVRAAVYGFRLFALAHPDLFRLFFNASRSIDAFGTEARSAAAESYEQLIRLVRRAHSAGALGDHEVTEVVVLWDAICCGLAIREVCGMIDRDQAEAIWLDGLRALLSGLSVTSSKQKVGPQPATD